MTQPVAQVRHVVARTGFANPLTLQILVADEDYLRVFADDTELNVGDDYVISGIGNPNGIAITIIGADDVNSYIGVESFTAVYQPPLDQLASLSTGGGIGRPFETALDQQNRRLQSIGGRVDRALKVPVYIEGDIELPQPVNGGVLTWDDDDGFIWGVPGGVPGAWATFEEAVEGLRLDRVMSPGRTRDFVEAYAPPLDADLTAIAALDTQPFGRDLLTMGTAEATRVRLREVDTLADFFAGAGYTYASGLMQVAAGDTVTVRDGGYCYEVAAADASDHHLLVDGIKYYVRGTVIWAEALGARPGDNSVDNGPIINKLLALVGATTRIGAGTYRCVTPIEWPASAASAASFHGAGRGLGTNLDFSAAADGTVCIVTNGTSARRRWGNFLVTGKRGATGTTGLALNGAKASGAATTRELIENITLSDQRIGLTGSYTWTLVLDAIEMRSCDLCLDLLPQSNNIHFNTPIFMNSKAFARFDNAEGVVMTNPLFQNIESDSTAKFALSLRQSSVTLINPYIEHIDQGSGTEFALVGLNRNQAGALSNDQIASDLVILGGVATQGLTIRHRRLTLALPQSHRVSVDSMRSPLGAVVITPDHAGDGTAQDEGSALTASSVIRTGGGSGIVSGVSECIQSIGADAAGFANPTTGPTPGGFFSTIARSGAGTFRHYVDGLTVDEWYTVAVLMRLQSTTTSRGYFRWRNGGIGGTSVRLDRSNYLIPPAAALEVKYVTLKALGDTLVLDELPKDINIDFYCFRLWKGIGFPVVDPFAG